MSLDCVKMKKDAAPTRRSTRAGKPVQISKPEKLDDSRTKSVKVAKSPATKGHVKKTGKLAMLIFFFFFNSYFYYRYSID